MVPRRTKKFNDLPSLRGTEGLDVASEWDRMTKNKRKTNILADDKGEVDGGLHFHEEIGMLSKKGH